MKRTSWIAALVVLSMGTISIAGTTTWTGSTDSDWFTSANWDSGVPGAGDDAVIGAGADVLLTNATAHLGSLTMSGGTLTFSNWFTKVEAANVTINGGTVTLPPAFNNGQMSNRVWFVCDNNFTLASGATIDAANKGFSHDSQGPGAGIENIWGAGHGGWGGPRKFYAFPDSSVGGNPYDSTNAPVQPGSGGDRANGGYGGGVVRIAAGNTVTINGEINVDGGSTTGDYGGGGSGGSIYITCNTFGGTATGLLSANGGASTWASWFNPPKYIGFSGSGGRIAVDYTNLGATHAVRFKASSGQRINNDNRANRGGAGAEDGTLWLPDTALLSETLGGDMFRDVRIQIPGFTTWSVDSLTVTNCSATFMWPGIDLTVTNDLIITDDSILGIAGNITVGGDVIMNNGSLYVYAGESNGAVADAGSEVQITGDMTLTNGSWVVPISDGINGGSVRFTMANISISEDSGFEAIGRGYTRDGAGGNGPGAGAYRGAGSSYGGSGGTGLSSAVAGPIYGVTNAPLQAGSCGGTAIGKYGAGFGGGLIWIETPGTAIMNGSLLADGTEVLNDYGGGGSGGGILVNANQFSGGSNATISANGGNGNSQHCAAGGGGRIAIWQGGVGIDSDYRNDLINNNPLKPSVFFVTNTPFASYTGSLSVTNGAKDTYGGASEGTIRFITFTAPAGGTTIIIR